jgi:hypothetical protein
MLGGKGCAWPHSLASPYCALARDASGVSSCHTKACLSPTEFASVFRYSFQIYLHLFAQR